MVDCCGPPAVCAAIVGTCVRGRIPLVLSDPTQWSDEDLARLEGASRKRKLPVIALGSLRLLPAAARVKEIASAGVLGALRSLRLERAGLDPGLVGGAPDPELTFWRDADLCHWLVAGEAICELATTDRTDGDRTERSVVLTGERGEISARFRIAEVPEIAVTIDGVTRHRRVPALGANDLHLAELQVAIAARRAGYPWLLLPSLADVVAARRAEPIRR
jgi:hypothetical protein